ncbi:MAG: hypothetical protein OXD01_08255 [Gammaproteobacteria bacterium]|nr:hypothetical protein [Gammaproteobacteria bacterium]
MNTYAVFLNESNVACWQNIRERWSNGRHFILTDHLAFVASEDITTTAEVSEKVGIDKKEGSIETLGVVFEVGAYNGFNKGDLWEWLGKVQS